MERQYLEILNEKEALFALTQPKATDYDTERVKRGEKADTFDRYIIEKERRRIDERLQEARKLLAERRQMLGDKREELKMSNDIKDKVYYFRYIEKKVIHWIAVNVNYSEVQIYRILRQITNMIENDRFIVL